MSIKVLLLLLISSSVYADWYMLVNADTPKCRYDKDITLRSYSQAFFESVNMDLGAKCLIDDKLSKKFGGVFLKCLSKTEGSMAVFYPNVYKCNKYKRRYEKFQKTSTEFKEFKKNK